MVVSADGPEPSQGFNAPTEYKYTPLPLDNTIRMLTLYPGSAGEALEGELEVIDIANPGDYEPISYVWGDPTPTQKMTCNGKELHLTKSLDDALRRMRLPDKPRRLWADQVCINQKDLDERSKQVQFMNGIYQGAKHVLVWLGPDEEGIAKSAFDLVSQLAATLGDKDSPAYKTFATIHTDDLEGQSAAMWKPLMEATKLPWFTRAWIVQEIGTKASATLFWGKEAIDWEVLYGVSEELTEFHHLRKQFGIETAEIKYIYQRFVEAQKDSRHANRFDFIYELHRARHLKASNPADRVFAFLGHYSLRNGENPQLKDLEADYNKTVEDVYTDTAIRALRGDRHSLITLAAVQHMSLPPLRQSVEGSSQHSTAKSPDTLPSWVPDWRTFQSYILSEPTSPHCAGTFKSPVIEVDTSEKVLRIRGVMVDTVAVCSAAIKSKEFHINGSRSPGGKPLIEALWRDVCGKDAFDLSEPYVGGGSAFFAYVQTLSNGCVAVSWKEQRAYEDYADEDWLSRGAEYVVEAMDKAGGSHSLKVTDELRSVAASCGSGSWSRAANGCTTNRKFARTTSGWYVLGPRVMEPGDVVCVLDGGKMPFCLRPWGDKYLLVGECYIHGMMRGEAAEDSDKIGARGDFDIV